MAGHPSAKKRQKEMARKERQAEKLVKRDQRRVQRNDPNRPPEDEFAEPFVEGMDVPPAEELPTAAEGPLSGARPVPEAE